MDPVLQVIQKSGENNLYLNPDSVYNFWKSRCPSTSPKVACLPKDFLVSRKKGIAFGRESDSPSERESFLDQMDCKLKISQESIMQSPNSESAESIVSGMIGEIRASASKSPASPVKSPPRNYQKLSSISGSFKLPLPVSPSSDIDSYSSEQMRGTQNAIEFLSDFKCTQTSIPHRLTDVAENNKIKNLNEYMPLKNTSPGQAFHENLSSVLKPSTGFGVFSNSNSCQNISLTSPSSSNQSSDFKMNNSVIKSSPTECTEKQATQLNATSYSSQTSCFEQEKIISDNFLLSNTNTEKTENIFSSFDSLSNLTAKNIPPKESIKININRRALNYKNNIKKNSGNLLSQKTLRQLKDFASRAKSSSLTPESSNTPTKLSKVSKQNSQKPHFNMANTSVKQVQKCSKKQLKARKNSFNNKYPNLTVSLTPNTSVRTISTCNSRVKNRNRLSLTQRVESDEKTFCSNVNDELCLSNTRTILKENELSENVITDHVTNKTISNATIPCIPIINKKVLSKGISEEKISNSSSSDRKKITFDLSPNNANKEPKVSNLVNKVPTSSSYSKTKNNIPPNNIKVQLKPSTATNEISDSSFRSDKIGNLNAVKRNVKGKPTLSNTVKKIADSSSNSNIIALHRTPEIQPKLPITVNKALESLSSSNTITNLMTCPKTIKAQPQSSDCTHSDLESLSSNDRTVCFGESQRNLELQHKPSKPMIKRNFSLNLSSEVPRYNVPKADVVTNLTSHESTVVRRNAQTVHIRENSKEVTVDSSKATKSFSGAGCSDEMFNKIVQFLNIKVTLKYKSLSSEEQHQRAVNLAQNFIKYNDAKLDKRTMKLLTEFAESHV